MGFGLLFVGYFFLVFLQLSSVDVLPNLAFIGSILMFCALKKTVTYCPDNKNFKFARKTLVALTAASILGFAVYIVRLFFTDKELMQTKIIAPIAEISSIIACIFTVFLMLGIYRLAKEVELPKLASRSVGMIAATTVYGILETISAVSSLFINGASINNNLRLLLNNIGFFSFVLEYLCLFLNLAVIFTCYMRICLEGDEDMPPRDDLYDRILAQKRNNKKGDKK